MAAATAKKTMIEVARPIEVRMPTPVMPSAAVATMTVPPAKTTAAPEVPIAFARARGLSWPVARFSRYRATTKRA